MKKKRTRAPAVKRTGSYRFTPRFISVTTRVLMGVLLGMVALGFILGFISDGVAGEAGETLGTIALGLILGGFLLPLLVAAVLGGEAIMAGGGIIGFLLIVGLVMTAAGSTEIGRDFVGDEWMPGLFSGGIILSVLAVAGFWVIGWIMKVPMWILGSRRTYQRTDAAESTDVDPARSVRRR
ncbi:hypothetical protein [Orlajensenia leifsoniae]|uniref:Uncharacterized protein n=1 Tax=Orlajensenia leifsoniae TaxID=2561933 RepID=A0A4Y9QSE2_9MICO|nr:hypothetical protein [Leifsonia flava]TFV95384.1 hypothetical protein E4M00_15170 [Leifsonia flava]